jgi:hypothetical protein
MVSFETNPSAAAEFVNIGDIMTLLGRNSPFISIGVKRSGLAMVSTL